VNRPWHPIEAAKASDEWEWRLLRLGPKT
jgi:hypothetical protein